MESSHQEDGGQFYWALVDLKFSPTHRGAYPNGRFKIFHLSGGGQQAFLYWGMGRVPPSLAKNSPILHREKSLLVDSQSLI